MRKVIRYLLEGDGSVPVFVEDGGYFIQGHDIVGISVDEDARHVPVTVLRLTRAELAARILATATDENGDPLDEQAASDMADEFLAAKGLADYQ